MKIGKSWQTTCVLCLNPSKLDHHTSSRKSKHGVELKVRVCKHRYTKEFKDENDVKLVKILAFCKVEEFIKVTGTIPAELFFA